MGAAGKRGSWPRPAAAIALGIAFCMVLGGCGKATPPPPTAPTLSTTTESRMATPPVLPTATPVPTPLPSYLPVATPGTPVVAYAALHERIRELSADPGAWNGQDAAAGWMMANGAIVITGDAQDGDAALLPGVALGTTVGEALAKVGKPIVRDDHTYLFVFESMVLALYGEENVEAAAFWPVDATSPVASTIRRLCDALYEYDRLFVRRDGSLLPAADGGLTLACFDGTRPFLAVYDRNHPTRWVAQYGASREHYWVNAHTFLRIEAQTWQPICYAFDLDAQWPQPRVYAYPMVDLHGVDPEILIDMRYASEDNFTGINLYGDLTTVYVPEDVAVRLASAHRALRRDYPHLRLLVFDVFRPKSMQQRMWDLVRGTEFEAILSDPSAWFSNHYIGMAVDLTLFDTRLGQELEMGTPFDSFERIAWPRYEAEHLASGQLSREAYENRLILRHFMESEGFTQLYFEWWHFDLHLPGGIPAMFDRFK